MPSIIMSTLYVPAGWLAELFPLNGHRLIAYHLNLHCYAEKKQYPYCSLFNIGTEKVNYTHFTGKKDFLKN